VGTITYIPANGWNLPDWSTPVISLSLVFSRQDIGFSMINWDGHQFKEVEKFALQHASVNIRDHILQLTEELAWSQDTTSETFSHLVLALANNIYDQLSQTTSNHINVSLIDDIKCYIDNNFDQSVSRDSVAAFFNISPSYLSRLFTRSSEVKFNEYLTQTRIAKSRLLLINTTLKIREISAKSGFIDNNYFCKVFKLINECTPMEYRKINRNHSLTNKS
jgi:YesN/AraC family two-component response regulator